MTGAVCRYNHWEGVSHWQFIQYSIWHFKGSAHWIGVDTVFKTNCSSTGVASVSSCSYFIKPRGGLFPVLTVMMVPLLATSVKDS